MTDQETDDETTQIYVGQIKKPTKKADLESHFKKFDAEIVLYKGFLSSPYAFLKVKNDKVDALVSAEHEVNGQKLEVNVAKPKVEVIKYFLDSRMTKGTLSELTEEQVSDYFKCFGEVVKLKILEKKGIGFLDMKKDDDNEDVSGLAWKTHEIEGHVINVKEQDMTRKRKRKWNNGRRGKKRFKRN